MLLAPALLPQAFASPAPDAVTADGGRYYGPLVAGVRQGEGRVEWDNGSRYEGGFDRGLFSGKGRWQSGAGDVYEGGFALGMKSGKGRLQTVRGEVYEGDFVDDEFTGTGSYGRPDGSRHDGGFLRWVPQGPGSYTDAHGNVYAGAFDNGELKGIARVTGRDGFRYEGELAQGTPHGEGTLQLPNGDVYKGRFANGRYDGQGTLTYARPRGDGRTQDGGTWRMGALEGTADATRTDRGTARALVEAALYNQRALLAQAIGALAPREEGRINLFLLAVAGDGMQEVFHREVDFVRAHFDRDFRAAGHSIALVNSRNTVATAPMATITSLREALAGIAARMDRAEDILFVFLTSHGSRDHQLVLDAAGMDLPNLPAQTLGAMLRDTGIRWKVVVVSACYSGGFIDPLKDGHTLVITAARRDRTSFGCADENEFTDFGRAYFKEALPRSNSFQDAFRKASELVDEWETRDGRGAENERSFPQMENPPLIEQHLRRWWSQAARVPG